MYAIKDFIGCEHVFMYNGIEYYPLDKAIKTDYIIRLKHIEAIDINE